MKKILLGLGLLSILFILAGCGSTPDVAGGTANANYEEISLGHDGWNTVPEVTTLPAGKSYKFTITPDKNGVGCMSTIKRKGTQGGDIVAQGRPIEMVIDNAQPGEYEFVCNGMGMRQGSIIIE